MLDSIIEFFGWVLRLWNSLTPDQKTKIKENVVGQFEKHFEEYYRHFKEENA